MDTTRALTENLAALLRREHHAFAEFLVALADFDRQRCWVELGHTSLFYFLHRELRLSKGAAQYRKVAAELIQRIPGAVEPLRQGRLCLTSIIEAAKVVTADNWETVLPRAASTKAHDDFCATRLRLSVKDARITGDRYQQAATRPRNNGFLVGRKCVLGEHERALRVDGCSLDHEDSVANRREQTIRVFHLVDDGDPLTRRIRKRLQDHPVTF